MNDERKNVRLVKRALSGCESAFQEIVCLHQGYIESQIRHLGCSCPDRLSEVCQKTWIRVWLQLDRFDSLKGKFRSWVQTIAKHVHFECVRAEASRNHHTRTIAESTPDPQEKTDHHASERLDSVVRGLPPEEKELLFSRYLKGYTFQEMATELGVSEDCAKNRVYRLLEKLRDKWNKG